MGTPLRPMRTAQTTPNSRPLTAAEGEAFRDEIVDAVNSQLIKAGILENQDSGRAHIEAQAIRESMVPIRWVVAKFERHEGDSGDDH